MKELCKYIKEGILDDDIKEGILDDDEDFINNMDINIIVCGLFSNDKKLMVESINAIKSAIINSNAKQVKTTNKIKNSNSFFIQFPIREKSTYDMLLLKRYGSNWYTMTVLLESKWNPEWYPRIDLHRDGWNTTQPNLSPKEDLMYEVPESFNNLCEEIINRTDNL